MEGLPRGYVTIRWKKSISAVDHRNLFFFSCVISLLLAYGSCAENKGSKNGVVAFQSSGGTPEHDKPHDSIIPHTPLRQLGDAGTVSGNAALKEVKTVFEDVGEKPVSKEENGKSVSQTATDKAVSKEVDSKSASNTATAKAVSKNAGGKSASNHTAKNSSKKTNLRKDQKKTSNLNLAPLVAFASNQTVLNEVVALFKEGKKEKVFECLKGIIGLNLVTSKAPCKNLTKSHLFVFYDEHLNLAKYAERYPQNVVSENIAHTRYFHTFLGRQFQSLSFMWPTNPYERKIPASESSSLFPINTLNRDMALVLFEFTSQLESEFPMTTLDVSSFSCPASFIRDFLDSVSYPYVAIVLRYKSSEQRSRFWMIESIPQQHQILCMRRLQVLEDGPKEATDNARVNNITPVQFSQLVTVAIFFLVVVISTLCLIGISTPKIFDNKGLSMHKLY